MGGLILFFASHPSVYTLPGTWEPQPDVLFDPTILLASFITAVVFLTQQLFLLYQSGDLAREGFGVYDFFYHFIMKEFDYDLDYKSALDFSVEENRNLYRIGRGEQGVLLVRPYTNTICAHWRFKTPENSSKII